MNRFRCCTPAGQVSNLCAEILEFPHVLIAGSTGSGKSVMLNNIIATALFSAPGNGPDAKEFIMLDPKRVELAKYENLPHVIAYAEGYNPESWKNVLDYAVSVMDWRYSAMRARGEWTFSGGDLYIIIDEWATIKKGDLHGKPCQNALLRLISEGRAARVHVILCTQVPKAEIIPTEIRENFPHRLALMTQTAGESRLLMGMNGCEELPYPAFEGAAYGYLCEPGNQRTLYELPKIPDNEIFRLIDHWCQPGNYRKLHFWER